MRGACPAAPLGAGIWGRRGEALSCGLGLVGETPWVVLARARLKALTLEPWASGEPQPAVEVSTRPTLGPGVSPGP